MAIPNLPCDAPLPDAERRRIVLALGAIGAGAALSRLSFASSRRNLPDYPFGLGVASGSPTADGFVLWTRLVSKSLAADRSQEVKWEVFEGDAPAKIVRRGVVAALPELGFAVHVEVSGLTAGRWYGYRFMVGDAVSVTGRTRTLPASREKPGNFRFALASCQRWEDGYYAAYRHMATDAPDAVIFVGDYIYEYKSRAPEKSVRTHDLLTARTLEGYRDHYALYKSDPDLQRMHALCPWITTWDDHEVENDYAGEFSGEGEASGVFAARRLVAYQAYFEHMPLPLAALTRGMGGLGKPGGLRLYHSLDVGDLATFHVLDNRQYRDAPLCGTNPPGKIQAVCQDAVEVSRTMLGHEQDAWLIQSLRRAAARGSRWNFLVQQTQFSPRNYAAGQGKRFSRDLWDGYPAARERLLEALVKTGASGPVIVGGDIHQNWIANVHSVPYDASSRIVASEVCGTSISSVSASPQAYVERLRVDSPHCCFAGSERRGYALFEIKRDTLSVDLKTVDDPTDASSTVSRAGLFVVAGDRPGIQLA